MAISLKLIWFNVPHPFKSDILCTNTKKVIRVRARLVRRLIWVEELLCSNHNNPKKIYIMYISNVTYINVIFLYYINQCREVYKETIRDALLYIKESRQFRLCSYIFFFSKKEKNLTQILLEKFFKKRSELKYLSNFRKRNQTRFYDQCE